MVNNIAICRTPFLLTELAFYKPKFLICKLYSLRFLKSMFIYYATDVHMSVSK